MRSIFFIYLVFFIFQPPVFAFDEADFFKSKVPVFKNFSVERNPEIYFIDPNTKVKQVLKTGRENAAQNSFLLNRILRKPNMKKTPIRNLQFPKGRYYFSAPIKLEFHTDFDWEVSMRISKGTSLIATEGIEKQPLFSFNSTDKNLKLGKLCIYSGENCSSVNSLGGTIDTQKVALPRKGVKAGFSNTNSIRAYGLNTLVVRGINFIGNTNRSDTFVDGTVKYALIESNVMNKTDGSAIYLNGHMNSQGIEVTEGAVIKKNQINNTHGISCKRGVKVCYVHDNILAGNVSSIACTGVVSLDSTHSVMPCKRLVATRNTIVGNNKKVDYGLWSQGIVLDWCNDNCIVSDNNISKHRGTGSYKDRGQKHVFYTEKDCDVRIINSSNVSVSGNYKDASKNNFASICDEGQVVKRYGPDFASHQSINNKINIPISYQMLKSLMER